MSFYKKKKKRRNKRGPVDPREPKTSGDGAGSILSWALTRSHHCLQHKIGSCHAAKWATSCAIRPRSVIDDQKWNMKEGSKEIENTDKQNHSKLVHILRYNFIEWKGIKTLWKELSKKILKVTFWMKRIDTFCGTNSCTVRSLQVFIRNQKVIPNHIKCLKQFTQVDLYLYSSKTEICILCSTNLSINMEKYKIVRLPPRPLPLFMMSQ